MKKLRKFLVVSVMVLSVFAMSGISAPASAGSASAGDLIKMEGLTSVYYLGADGKRYVFPNSTTYFSWYPDFSGVVTIPASELQSYPLGGNVTMRAGTKLVKITTDPSVYAVSPDGVLHKIGSEAQAAALYGTEWAKRVVDVPDAFFTNYSIGSALTDGAIPAGSLVKNSGSADVYYYDGTDYSLIPSDAVAAANRFDYAYALTVTATISATGSAVTAGQFANVAQNGSTNGPVVTGSGLMVSLNASTPAAISIPKNGVRVPMAKVNLTAASDGDVSVNSITVKRSGLSAYGDVDKVWAEKDGAIVASKKSMNSNDESILVFSPALTIAAGQTTSIDLLTSLSGSGTGNIALSITSASAVSATATTVSGSFPITGNLMSLTAYTVAKLSFDANDTSPSVKVGDVNVELGKFTVDFNTNGVSAKDVSLSSITLKNNGVEDLSTATNNLFLENSGNKVSDHYTIDGRYVTFYFPTTGFNILKDDSSKILYIKGDILAKENTGTSFVFVLNKSTDLVGQEISTGFGVNVYTDSSGSTLANSQTISTVTITAGAVAVTKKATSPSDTTIIKGSDNVVLLANLRTDEAITADGLNVLYTDAPGSGTTTEFENVRVYLNGILLDSFDPDTITNETNYPIDSTLNLLKGDNEVKVIAKAKSTADAVSTFKVKIDGTVFDSMNPEYVVSGNVVSTSSGDISGTAEGSTFTVQGAVLETVKNDGYANNKVIVKGSTDVSLGKFVVKSTNDTSKVTSISLGTNAGAPTKTLASSIYDMKLYVDGVQTGSTVNFGSTGATFSSLNFDIAKDATKNIELKGSFDSSAVNESNFKTVMTINAQDSRGASITSGNIATTTNFVINDNGTLNVALGGDTPVASMLATKGTEQEVAQFKFTAINDDADITEIKVVNTPLATSSSDFASTSVGVADADARIASVKLYDGATLISSFVPVSGAGTFTITDSKAKVLAGQNKTLSIKVVLNDIENDGDATDKDIHFGVTTLKFKSSVGTESTQGVALLANNFRIRKTIPTIAPLTLPTTVLTAGDLVISKFTVTADANGDVEVNKIVLDTTDTANATITALGVNSVLKIDGSYKTVATSTFSSASSTLTIDLGSNNVVVSAGTSKTFEILATLAVSGTGSEAVTSKISEDSSYATDGTGNFVWSDGASVSAPTYSNARRVSGLTTATQVLSK